MTNNLHGVIKAPKVFKRVAVPVEKCHIVHLGVEIGAANA